MERNASGIVETVKRTMRRARSVRSTELGKLAEVEIRIVLKAASMGLVEENPR